LRFSAEGVSGSGPRANLYGHALDGAGNPVAGTSDRIEVAGTLRTFERSNDLDPAPAAELFTGKERGGRGRCER
jgi:hypothetical protein